MKFERLKNIAEKHPRTTYYLVLICAVTIIFFLVNALMLAGGRELVWTRDARPLYVNYLVWASGAIERMLDTLSSGGGLVFPFYTFSMGYGADVPMSMGGYLQDPLNLIVALLPIEMVGFSYALMSYVRLVLAAVFFSWFCFGHGMGKRAALVASLAYVTCGLTLFLGVLRHPKFIDWAILLPLILHAADKMFEGKGRVLFAFAMFLQFTISIYFSYMTCITVLVYCLVKYFFMPRNRGLADFVKLVASFLACGIIAFLMSAIFSMPQIVALLSQGRATTGHTVVDTLFSFKYYMTMLPNLLGSVGVPEGMLLGAVSIIGVCAFIVCGKRFDKSEHRAWMVGVILVFVGISVPFFGHVMNGMGYTSDRWMLLLGFVCAYVLGLCVPVFSHMDKRDWFRVSVFVGVVAILAALCVVVLYLRSETRDQVLWAATMLVLFVVVFLVLRRLGKRGGTTAVSAFLSISIIVCITASAGFYCSSYGQSWAKMFPKAGQTWQNIENKSPSAAIEALGTTDVARYSVPRVYDSMRNSALAHDPIMGVDYYTSFYNQSVDDFRQGLGISDHHMNFSFAGSDSRTAIENLTGVKYYVCKDYDVWRVPQGFKDTQSDYKDYFVYENENAIPLAFTTNNVIDAATYEELSMAQKQEALLQGAVVDSAKLSNSYRSDSPTYASQELPFSIAKTDGVTCEDGVFHVMKEDATVTLSFTGIAKSEQYLCLYNLGYAGYSPIKRAELENDTYGLGTRFRDLMWTEATTYPITASIGEHSNAINPATPKHIRYGGKVNWLFNLGYFDDAVQEMTITFDRRGDYTYDTMSVVAQPIAPILDDSRALSAQGLQDIELGTNTMKATATLESDDPEIAVFTVAYSPGWSVTVDGEKADVVKTDVAFMGVELSGKGTHTIEWKFETPGVHVGGLMSILGIVAFIALIAVTLASRRHSGEK